MFTIEYNIPKGNAKTKRSVYQNQPCSEYKRKYGSQTTAYVLIIMSDCVLTHVIFDMVTSLVTSLLSSIWLRPSIWLRRYGYVLVDDRPIGLSSTGLDKIVHSNAGRICGYHR